MNLMDIIGRIIAIIVGLFAIVGGLYQFIKFIRWYKARTPPKVTHPNANTAQLYIVPQQRALEVWRLPLIDPHRDIKMTDIYVQEVLQAPGVQRSFDLRTPSIHEREVLKWISGVIEEDKQVYIITGQAGSGKSTMLGNWTLSLLAKHQEPIAGQLPPIPLYLSLRHISAIHEAPTGELAFSRLAKCLSRTIPGLDDNAAELPFSMVQTLRSEELVPRRKSFLARLLKKGLQDRKLRVFQNGSFSVTAWMKWPQKSARNFSTGSKGYLVQCVSL